MQQDEELSFLPFFYSKAIFWLKQDDKALQKEWISTEATQAQEVLEIAPSHETAFAVVLYAQSIDKTALESVQYWPLQPLFFAPNMLTWPQALKAYPHKRYILVGLGLEFISNIAELVNGYFHSIDEQEVLSLSWPYNEAEWQNAMANTKAFWR